MTEKRRGPRSEKDPASLEDEIFDIENREIPDGAWWWFWLFFIDDPAKTEKPR